MENILYKFNEKVISLVTKYLENTIGNGELSNFTDEMLKELMNLGQETAEFLVNYAEEKIYELDERKEEFWSLEKDNRKIITIFGEINFKRRYYEDKETKEKIYLLDQYLGLEPKQRMLTNVKERLLEEAIESSYEKAGKRAAYGIEISKETVMNEIEKLEIKPYKKEVIEKKQEKRIYVIADEDHVHLQKGGIDEPRMVIVYDGIERKGKRIELKNKRHFGGIYKSKIDDLWEEVMNYIEETYDTEYLEKIYIAGDGASWIKSGKEWLIKSEYILDEFHMKKAISGIVGRPTKENKEVKEQQKEEMQRVLRELNFESFKEKSYEIIAEEMQRSSRERKIKLMEYILNNEEGIRNLYKNKEELHGCSAEGHISHIYSARMSSRPMGWKTENVDKMSKLRLLKEDKVSIREILKNANKVIEFEEIKKIKSKIDKKIKTGINFNPQSIPAVQFGDIEEKIQLKRILRYKAV